MNGALPVIPVCGRLIRTLWVIKRTMSESFHLGKRKIDGSCFFDKNFAAYREAGQRPCTAQKANASMDVKTRTASEVADFFFMIRPRVAERADSGSLARGFPFFPEASEMV